jgi:glycosyltransferase involved in cell wall biosynthesis
VRILHVNKFLYRRGGAEGYLFDVAQLQRDAGHEVAFFGMAHPDNEATTYASSFPSHREFDPTPASAGAKLGNAGRMVWSTSAARGIDEVLAAFRPDVVHLHNVYHQLSPSILRPVARRSIPAVMTLHDYKLACPTYRFLDHGTPCEACVPRKFWNAGIKACNGSRTASAMAGLELGLHTLTGAYRPVRRFVCPSRFLESKMRAGKVFPDRLRWLPNFVDVDRWSAKDAPGTGAVFAGRLSDEKGVDVAVRAVAALPTATLDVAGDGPARPSLEALATEIGVADRVRFHGRLATPGLRAVLQRAAVAVVPSRWYENQPLAVLEAFASGLPVVGTDLGGIPELIDPGVDGAIVAADDPSALADAVGPLLADPDLAFGMGTAGRAKAERDHGPAQHLESLFRVYDEARGMGVAA